MFVCHIQVLDRLFSPTVTALFLRTSPVSRARANSADCMEPDTNEFCFCTIWAFIFILLCVMCDDVLYIARSVLVIAQI